MDRNLIRRMKAAIASYKSDTSVNETLKQVTDLDGRIESLSLHLRSTNQKDKSAKRSMSKLVARRLSLFAYYDRKLVKRLRD